jgi:hypothetical protein
MCQCLTCLTQGKSCCVCPRGVLSPSPLSGLFAQATVTSTGSAPAMSASARGCPRPAIESLRDQCKPEEVAKKPKPVTDQQLLKIVDELKGDLDRAHSRINGEREYIERRGSDTYEQQCRLEERIEDLEAGRKWLWLAFFALSAFCCFTLVVAK